VGDATTSQPLHWPISAYLYLPEVWTEDRARCERVRVPESVTFATKPKLALQLLDRAKAWGVLYGTVVTEAGYGIPSFVRALDDRGVPYVCALAYDFGVRLPHEMLQAAVQQTTPVPRRRGQPKKPRPAPRHDVRDH